MSRDQLARADVAVLVIDAQKGATVDDAKLASFIEESGRATVIVLNKADLMPRAELDARIEATRKTLSFVGYAPTVLTSARTGRGVLDIPAEARRVFKEWSRRVATSDLNKNFEQIVTRRPPPSGPGGKHVRLYYATQADVCPPTFYVSSNLPKAIGDPYQRYLVNQLRQVYGFAGSPIRVALRAHRQSKDNSRRHRAQPARPWGAFGRAEGRTGRPALNRAPGRPQAAPEPPAAPWLQNLRASRTDAASDQPAPSPCPPNARGKPRPRTTRPRAQLWSSR